PAGARDRVEALPAGDPPDELLPRAVPPPRGRVPGLRGRGESLAGPAVLPRAQRGAGGPGGQGSRGGDRRGPAGGRARSSFSMTTAGGAGGALGRTSATRKPARRYSARAGSFDSGVSSASA